MLHQATVPLLSTVPWPSCLTCAQLPPGMIIRTFQPDIRCLQSPGCRSCMPTRRSIKDQASKWRPSFFTQPDAQGLLISSKPDSGLIILPEHPGLIDRAPNGDWDWYPYQSQVQITILSSEQRVAAILLHPTTVLFVASLTPLNLYIHLHLHQSCPAYLIATAAFIRRSLQFPQPPEEQFFSTSPILLHPKTFFWASLIPLCPSLALSRHHSSLI